MKILNTMLLEDNMKYLIVSFKNRNNLMAFNQLLVRNGLNTSIINTPRSVAVSCGLSIKADLKYLTKIINLLHGNNFNDFIGIFLYSRTNGHDEIRKLA